ncbi:MULTISPECIES: hypothetical protein [unclassified Mesorhizobium]|uniref:hypothetical protein n=1 Tax=unclassified Mesorhizobium TaxID=325217 RepID=UPI000FCB0FFB|nr:MULTISPECIES: hypothetical protein [unclassified Mesorhizobium]TGP22336.1 hypothetical protein EN874_019695 [Mesorhizobium sp. M1D.F.Ca.ET.231.01.1.1]TGP24694.1 hypothetical protein EN877_30500 [Mesorhizobium sp. M1D.F.Ca.ET.234.01.1.1]TGS37297.1 hypothetical protein EN827_30805 [Mesorhizobium sp. M1D.F.Ca.ET.184.01.1.1]TGS58097.1 hypothetical protein EN826_030780 [Mesorhizobium sp. M1D.F.Ca.ET.183.01.1.1]
MPRHPETLHEQRRRCAYVAALESVEPIETAFDRVVNWLAEHPRFTAALICIVALAPLALEVPR